MKTTLTKLNLRVLLALGALTLALASPARAIVPRAQVQFDTDAESPRSDSSGAKIEQRIIVTDADADSDSSAAKQERRVVVRARETGDKENEADGPRVQQKKI